MSSVLAQGVDVLGFTRCGCPRLSLGFLGFFLRNGRVGIEPRAGIRICQKQGHPQT